jgi:2-polyprenyl-3-methyl-5-hydroxy-6-metoxy-1,4-benzoquinol methylase
MDLREAHSDVEVRHPWEVSRFRFFHNLLRQEGLITSTTSLLDIGSGDAWFASELVRKEVLPQVTCWDLHYDGESAARLGVDTSTIRLTNSRPPKRFDVILMLDVLEHIEEDHWFLQQTIQDNLNANGRILISVPAWQSLYSAHDETLDHYRRYHPTQLRELLVDSGLHILTEGGLFHSLLLPRGLTVAKEKLVGRKKQATNVQWKAGPLATKIVNGALQADNWVSAMAASKGVSLPGLSVWALCEQA